MAYWGMRLIRFMHGIMRNGLLGYEAYQVHARADG